MYVTPVSIDVYLYVHMHVKSKDKLFSLGIFCIIYIFILVGKLLIYLHVSYNPKAIN